MNTGHDLYIKDQLANDDSIWKICSWHKAQNLMQVESKSNEVGWAPYEECRKGGAIVATAHEHSYQRTHLMDNFETQSIASTSKVLQLEMGKTVAFVSGLGGRSVKLTFDAPTANPWWASVYTSAQGANFGALFCEFNKDGDENKAHCYFKDIDGVITDEFDILAAEPVPVVGITVPAEQQSVTFQEALDILGSTGVILPLVDSTTGGFSAGTFDKVGAEQLTFTWSEPPDAFDIPAGFNGSVPVVTMNGVDEFADTPDADYWSPGDGAADTPFSIGAWFYQEHLSGGVTVYALLTKMDFTDGHTAREWSLLADKSPRMRLCEESSNGRQDRFVSPGSKSIKGFLHLVATYSGSGGASGVKIYIEGARIDKSTDTGGSYTAMENTDCLVRLGYWQGTPGGDEYLRGKIAGGALGPGFVYKELTDAEVKSLYELGKKLLQLP